MTALLPLKEVQPEGGGAGGEAFAEVGLNVPQMRLGARELEDE
jgi:hypothetical protein